MNPGIDQTSILKNSLTPPSGWSTIRSGRLIEGDLVYSQYGWSKPNRLGTNAKVLLAIRRNK